MSDTALKPRVSTSLGLILAGAFIGYFGIRIWILLGGYLGLIPAVFGVIGLLWFLIGLVTLVRRKDMALVISEAGVEIAAFSIFQKTRRSLVRREDVVAVAKYESIQGRMIEISTSDGRKLLLDARRYCELNDFLAHCKRYGLPVA